MPEPTKPKSRRGFASMTKEQRVAIAKLGGAAVPAHKRSFSQDRKLAAEAGRAGSQGKRQYTRKGDSK
jgi:general stress protein YciG